MKTREISFTTGIPEIDRRTENRILNASIVLIFGTDIEGMRTFLRRNICGRTARMSGDRPDGRHGKEKNEAVLSFGADGFIRPFGISEKPGFRIRDILQAAENGRRTTEGIVQTIVIDPEKQTDSKCLETAGVDNSGRNDGRRDHGTIEAAVRKILNDAAERGEKIIAVFIVAGSTEKMFGCGDGNDSRRQNTANIRLAAETVLEFRLEENSGLIERYIIVHRLSAGDPIDRKIGYTVKDGEIVIEQTKRVY